MKASAIKIGIIATVLIALAAGCATKEKSSAQQRPAYSHKIHIGQVGLECATCHDNTTTNEKAGMPAIETCQTCHADNPEVLAPFVRDGKPHWSTFTSVSDHAKFSHKRHVGEEELKCDNCHGDMSRLDRTSKQLRFSMDTCTNCHAERNVKTDCSSCHMTISKDTPPKSHELNWKRFHGQQARAQLTDDPENRCSLCHTEQTCATCHKDTEPESHVGGMWRGRGHGIQARMDRSSCAVCHQSDTCDTCHRDTTPVTHRGAWGEPRDNHCYTCHFPAQNESCLTCHKELTGHMGAPGLPGGVTHETASEFGCRSCHEPGLSHPDNGDSCRNCHR